MFKRVVALVVAIVALTFACGDDDASSGQPTTNPSDASTADGFVPAPPVECRPGSAGCTIVKCVANDPECHCPAGSDCTFDCSGTSTCGLTTLDCGDSSCNVICSGTSSCQNTTIKCGRAGCSVHVYGSAAGQGATVICGDGPCDVSCESTYGCSSSLDVQCGSGPCNVTCNEFNASRTHINQLCDASASCGNTCH